MNARAPLTRGGLSVTDEQAAVVDHARDHTVTVVSAGAGSGKTWTTLATVLELVETQRASVDAFALITFTNAAALELRSRLDDALRKRIAAASTDARGFWEDQQERASSAFVGTIHSFCARMLRTYGYEERVAREMAVSSSRMLLDRAIEEALEAHLDGTGRLLGLDVAGYELARLVRDVLEHLRGRGLTPAAVHAATAAQAGDAGKPYRHDLAAMVADVSARYTTLKAERNGLDQTDLLSLTLALLTGGSGAAVAARVAARHPFVFVDEFQDTDRLQKGILDALLPHLHGLLVVGDRKQSIYGFRAADVSILRELAAENGVPILPLSVSRRPSEPLLRAQNALFTAMATRYEEFNEVLTGPVDAPPRDQLSGPAMRYVSAGDQATEEQRITAAAGEVREVLRARRMALSAGGERQVEPGEVVVLLRGNAKAVRYARELQRLLEPDEIDVRADAGGGLYSQPEIVSTCHMLRLLLNHPDDTALSMALRTPYLRDVDLTVEEQRILQMSPGDEYPLTDWFEDHHPEPAGMLAELRAAVRTDTVPQILARLYEAFDIRRHYLAGGQTQAAQNLEKLREIARGMFRSEQALTLRQFVRQLELNILRGAEESEALPDAADAAEQRPPFVRVMTVHRSKGLEFPVVVLPEVQASLANEQRQPVFVVDAMQGLDLALSAGGVSTASPRFAAAAARSREETLAEEMRILYVAVTRAQQAVVFVGSGERLPHQRPASPRYAWKDEIMPAARALSQAGAEFVRLPG